jgi:hypothetical protein
MNRGCGVAECACVIVEYRPRRGALLTGALLETKLVGSYRRGFPTSRRMRTPRSVRGRRAVTIGEGQS